MNKYTIVVESNTPPQVYLDSTIPNVGKVVEIKSEQLPNRVDAAWLEQRFSLSRKALIQKLRPYNRGSDTKHLYDPKEVIPILENPDVLKARRGAPRKN